MGGGGGVPGDAGGRGSDEGGFGGGGGGLGGGGMDAGGGAPQMLLTVFWQSALPVKQALVRARFGAEAAGSAEAKKFLEREEKAYIVAVQGFPMGILRMDPETAKKRLASTAALQRKGKAAIAPSDVDFAQQEKALIVYYLFPKTEPITLDDKDVEFVAKVGPVEVKRKFKLQDMVYDGKLQL
jgi:hypothetical protein